MYFVYQKQINVASERNYSVDYYTKYLNLYCNKVILLDYYTKHLEELKEELKEK